MAYDKRMNPDCISMHELNWVCSLHFRDWKIVYAITPQHTNAWVWLQNVEASPIMDEVIVDVKRKFT